MNSLKIHFWKVYGWAACIFNNRHLSIAYWISQTIISCIKSIKHSVLLTLKNMWVKIELKNWDTASAAGDSSVIMVGACVDFTNLQPCLKPGLIAGLCIPVLTSLWHTDHFPFLVTWAKVAFCSSISIFVVVCLCGEKDETKIFQSKAENDVDFQGFKTGREPHGLHRRASII